MYLQKVISKKLDKILFVGVSKVTDEKREPDSDPLIRGTDSWIRIRTKISRIRTTALKGLSHEMDFKNVDENLQMLALVSAAAGF